MQDDDSESGDKKVGEEWKEDDLSGLSAVELMRKRNEMIETAKQEISDIALNLLAQPQQQIDRLRVLIGLCKGERIHSLIRETVQKLAIASTVEVFVDIIPGYAIRPLSEEEKSQKMKKETKKLHDYENTLLNYYNKYLQVIEKNVTKALPKKGSVLNEATFTYKLAIVSLRSLCKLLVDVPHFNFSTNIISLLVRLTTSKHETVIDECCNALSKLFKSDLSLKYCAFAARAISAIVNEKKSTTDHVSSKLLLTLLCMNIKEIDMQKDDHGKEKEKLLGKRFKLAKERQSKTKNKYSKQLKKLESDLKEIEAAESLTTKVKYATEAMKYIFLTYFRVIKHMPNSNLLEPVLEGLSKFAHLLNVEFFDDIVSALQTLVDQQHMKVLDSLHCIHAVFVILSGEGSAINVDPYRFYKSIYRIMNDIPFEKRSDVRDREMILLLKSLHLMINHRRKQVILCRVAAFVKRLLHISFLLPTNYTIAILCAIRTFFISHPRLNSMLECDDDDRSVVNKSSALDVFIPEVNDPDCCNALSTSIILETDLLSKHPNAIISQLAKNIRAACPSSGANRVSADLSNWFVSFQSLIISLIFHFLFSCCYFVSVLH
ncbi:unnamed protein product [Anisakis simplex]|uniref:NOC3-like protein n=1 Tax=Anisakis simplex TaxID=6269 RepID=A0A0M3J0V9_ANISI|nr:unnamed protein product [Anisakis simplex]